MNRNTILPWLCILPALLGLADASLSVSSPTVKKLTFEELRSMNLLEKSEIGGEETDKKGIKAILVPSEQLLIIAGITSRRIEEQTHIKGKIRYAFIKVMRGPGEENEVIFKKSYDAARDLVWKLEAHITSEAGLLTFLVSLGNSGSTFLWTENVLLFYDNGYLKEASIETPAGPIDLKDLDGDGLDEIIVHSSDAGVSLPNRTLWYDVITMGRSGSLVKVNERYPGFYRDLIKNYYKRRLDETPALFKDKPAEAMEEWITVNKRLLERAKRLAGDK